MGPLKVENAPFEATGNYADSLFKVKYLPLVILLKYSI